MVAFSFNAVGVKPNVALEAIPTGLYPVMITKSEEKPTKAGNGSYIEFEMTVQGGEFAGRKVFDRLNTNNPNSKAVEIAYSTLSAICHVTNRLQMTDTTQLHGIPFIAVVSKLPRDDQPSQMTNEVKGYKDINGNDPGVQGGGAQTSAAPSWAGGQQQPPQQQIQQQASVQQVQYQQPVQQVQQQAPVQQQQPAWVPPGQQAQPVQVVQQPVVQQAQQPVQQQPVQQVQQQQTPPPADASAPPPWVLNAAPAAA